MLLGNGEFSGCSVREEHVPSVAIGGNIIPFMQNMLSVCLTIVCILVCFIRIVVHALLISSLVIDMRTLSFGLKNERGTHSLSLEYTLT